MLGDMMWILKSLLFLSLYFNCYFFFRSLGIKRPKRFRVFLLSFFLWIVLWNVVEPLDFCFPMVLQCFLTLVFFFSLASFLTLLKEKFLVAVRPFFKVE